MGDKYHERMLRCLEIAERKAKDYSVPTDRYSNFRFASIVAEPFDGVNKVFATLIGVKLARLAVLLSSPLPPSNESIADTFDDLTNYAALWGGHYDSEFGGE